jgi:protein KRI1
MKKQFGDDFYNDHEDDNFDPKLTALEDEMYAEDGEYPEEYENEYYDEGQDQDWNNEDSNYENNEQELYDLDYEDLIDGMPCRFKYRTVEPDDFGLTVDDILLADDKELNKYVGLRKVSGFSKKKESDGEKTAQKLSRKRKQLRDAIRERLETEKSALPTTTTKSSNDKKEISKAQVDEADGANTEKKKRKRNKKKSGDVSNSSFPSIGQFPFISSNLVSNSQKSEAVGSTVINNDTKKKMKKAKKKVDVELDDKQRRLGLYK